MAERNATKKLSPIKRAAAVVVALGAANASEVYKHLSEEEIELLSIEVAQLNRLSPDEMQVIVDDFYGLCVTQKVIEDGGVLYAKNILEKAFGAELANEYMQRISQSMQSKSFEFLRKASPKNILMMIQNEHPQTIAFVLSYTRPDQASKILSEIPKAVQLDVIKRIANLDSVSPDFINIVEKVLERKFSAVVSFDMTKIGGVNYVADIINHSDRSTEKYIFDELGKTDPELSENIRKLMFVFDDITMLDDMSIQRVLREVDRQDLAIAIKGSSEDVKNLLLSNISSRVKDGILEDIQYLRNVRLKDVEEAQQKIVGIIRRLEEEGEIVISRGGEEDVIIA